MSKSISSGSGNRGVVAVNSFGPPTISISSGILGGLAVGEFTCQLGWMGSTTASAICPPGLTPFCDQAVEISTTEADVVGSAPKVIGQPMTGNVIPTSVRTIERIPTHPATRRYSFAI